MGKLRESAASLGFFGDDLDPREITAALGSEPSVGVRTGELWRTGSGAEKVAVTGSWRISAERRTPGDLDGQINDLLNGLSDDFSAWRLFSQRYRGRVFCGLFLASENDGLTLRSETVARLGQRGLLIELDIYSPDDPT